MNQKENRPPQIALTFFYWYCHPDFREEIEGDLIERFNNYSLEYGHRKADRLFIMDVLFLFRPFIVGNIYHLTTTGTMEITNQKKTTCYYFGYCDSATINPAYSDELY